MTCAFHSSGANVTARKANRNVWNLRFDGDREPRAGAKMTQEAPKTAQMYASALSIPVSGAIDWLDEHRRTVGKNLGDSLHDFSRVVARAHNGVSTQFSGMAEHQIESFRAGPFTKLSQEGNIATHKSLQTRADGPED